MPWRKENIHRLFQDLHFIFYERLCDDPVSFRLKNWIQFSNSQSIAAKKGKKREEIMIWFYIIIGLDIITDDSSGWRDASVIGPPGIGGELSSILKINCKDFKILQFFHFRFQNFKLNMNWCFKKNTFVKFKIEEEAKNINCF